MTKLIPANELDRLAALASYDILEVTNEAVFNDLAIAYVSAQRVCEILPRFPRRCC